MGHSPLVMMYSHDGFGLGHLRRNSLIARKLVAEFPECHVLLLTGHSETLIELPFGIDSIKIPSIIKTGTGQWRARTLSIDPDRFRKLRSALIEQAARYLEPDLLLVDYIPTGVWDELYPTLSYLRSLEHPTNIVFGLRDILDDPAVIPTRWRNEGVYDVLRRYYDEILIYGDPNVYDTARTYELDAAEPVKVTYCGYLCPEAAEDSRVRWRRELRLQKKKLLAVAAGGGYDAYPMMSLALQAFRLIQEQESVEAIVVPGPLMPEHQVEALEDQARDLPVRFLHGHRDSTRALGAADVTVTMAGYNTLAEVLSLGTPVIVIPREGPSLEQTLRAGVLAQRELVTGMASPRHLPPGELAEAIRRRLHEPRRSTNGIDMNGLGRAVEAIARILRERRTGEHPVPAGQPTGGRPPREDGNGPLFDRPRIGGD